MLLLLMSMQLLCGCIFNTYGSVCRDGDVRLVGGSRYGEGAVEVCRNQQWGRVCDDHWDDNEAGVACRQLGFPGGEALMDGRFRDNIESIPYILDDLGCTGSEINLLECLPAHNCDVSHSEDAIVSCGPRGGPVRLEHHHRELGNNSLITPDQIKEAPLLCSTDRRECCFNHSSVDGGWYMPNGAVIPSTADRQQAPLQITRGNQTLELSFSNIPNSLSVSAGVYHCELRDEDSNIHHLYVGIYPQNEGHLSIRSLHYERSSQTVVCLSTGGPVTSVIWSKDSFSLNVEDYVNSQIIINSTSATYENRLQIVNKSSDMAGNYTCEVQNSRGVRRKILYIEVCRDMELRFSESRARSMKVCVDDTWWQIAVIRANGSDVAGSNRLTMDIASVDSTSVKISWSLQRDTLNVTSYDVTCTSVSQGQINEAKVVDIRSDVTTTEVKRLLPDTSYECCVTVHMILLPPIVMKGSKCVSTMTSAAAGTESYTIAVGTAAALGVCLLLISVGLVVAVIYRKHAELKQRTRSGGDDNSHVEQFEMMNNALYSNLSRSIRDGQNLADNPQQQGKTDLPYEVIDLANQCSREKRSERQRERGEVCPLSSESNVS